MITHITTETVVTSRPVVVRSVHRSERAARTAARRRQADIGTLGRCVALPLCDGPFGARDPRRGDSLAIYREMTGVYAVRPR